jgi:AcrR family transcriptional regulator
MSESSVAAQGRAASEARRRSAARDQRRLRTRQRIVEAAVELHSTVGPARTSYSAVARKAGVSRPTLYAYFPHEEDLFKACTAHVFVIDPPPDPRSWAAIPDPVDRLPVALGALYAHYRRNEARMANILRDASAMKMPEFEGRTIQGDQAAFVEMLAAGWKAPAGRERYLRAVIAHALAFTTWQTLTRPHDLSDGEAAALMVALAVAATGR